MNNVWAGYQHTHNFWDVPFWELEIDHWRHCMDAGPRVLRRQQARRAAAGVPSGLEAFYRRFPKRLERAFPEYTGLAVAVLAADPEVVRCSGELLSVHQLALEYDFTDIDGRQQTPGHGPQ